MTIVKSAVCKLSIIPMLSVHGSGTMFNTYEYSKCFILIYIIFVLSRKFDWTVNGNYSKYAEILLYLSNNDNCKY